MFSRTKAAVRFFIREPLERFISYFNYISMSDEESKKPAGKISVEQTRRLVEMAKSCKDVEEFYFKLLEDDDPPWNTFERSIHVPDGV